MYAHTDYMTRESRPSAARPTRASLRTRPRIQRVLIRSWEYVRPVRVSILAIRMVVGVWLVVLGAVLTSAGYAWGWALLPAAVAMFAISVWVFSTAAKG
jgi:hypothetical protein